VKPAASAQLANVNARVADVGTITPDTGECTHRLFPLLRVFNVPLTHSLSDQF
jgi:hypothetical protein